MSVADDKYESNLKFANKAMNFTINNFEEKQDKNIVNAMKTTEKYDAKMSCGSNGKSLWPHLLSEIMAQSTSLNLELKKMLVDD